MVSGDNAPLDRARLVEMTAALAFRGPDAQEVWAQDGIELGCALLRTTRESRAEHQPLTSDRVWIVADARVDARRELIAEFRAMQDPVAGRSAKIWEEAPDVELILHAYLIWGEQCVGHLLGDFAFIIWDDKRQMLFCARDQLGRKQIYYARAGNELILSNTLDCVRLHPAVSARVNERAIGDFLLTDYNQEPSTTTFYQDIHVLPPAYSLTFDRATLRLQEYWRLPEDGYTRYKRADEYVDHFREILSTAVADRLRTNRAGVTLSGGMDSSSVLALARAECLKEPEKADLFAYVADYRSLTDHSDAETAHQLSDYFGIPLHFWLAAEHSLFPYRDDPSRRLPEPINGMWAIQQVELMRVMAPQTRVALLGHAGDPAMFPYRAYFLQLLRAGRIGQLTYDLGTYLLTHGHLPPLYFRTALRERASDGDIWSGYPRWLNPAFEARLDLRGRWREYIQSEDPLYWTPARRLAHLVNKDRLVHQTMLDPGVTGVPVEPRLPFADVRVVNFLLAIPPVPWRIHKELLRRAMRGLLPDFVRLRAKSHTLDVTSELLTRSKSPLPDLLTATPSLANYVDPGQARESLSGFSNPGLRMNLRPLCLANWLLRVEQVSNHSAG